MMNFLRYIQPFGRTLITLVILLFLVHMIEAQQILNGSTGEPVAHASVLVVGDEQRGTNSEEDGRFTLDVPVGTQLRISSVGFKPFVVEYEGTDQLIFIDPQIDQLEEIVVKADESEAARIIGLYLKNRDKNAPKERPFFQCQLYNKYKVDLLQDSSATKGALVKMLEKQLAGETVFFSESAMDYKFQGPDRVESKIIANNVAGFSNAAFNFVPEQIVPFDIQTEFLDLLNRHYLLPLSSGSQKHYGLHIEDPVIIDGDTTWMIQFWPEKANYDLLRGHIIIHSDGYALQECRLTNDKKDHQRFDIFHEYRQVDGEWFPYKMQSNVLMEDPGLGIHVLYDQQTFIGEVSFEPSKVSVASSNRMVFEDGVIEDPELIEQYRTVPLTTEDSAAIKIVKQTSTNLNLERKMDIIANLSFGRFPLGIVDIDIPRLFWSNPTEGYRPGFGLITNDKFSERWGLEAFAGYGLVDEQWKYGGGAFLHLNKNETATLYGRYEKEVNPISSFVSVDAGTGILSNLFNLRIDDFEAWTAGLRGRWVNWRYDFNFQSSVSEPRYAYAYLAEGATEPSSRFEQSTFNLRFDYVKRKYIPFYTYEIEVQDNEGPLWIMDMSFAPNSILGNDLSFFKVDAFLKYPIHFKHLGRLELALHTGTTFGDRPINQLHIANGSRRSGVPIQLRYAFNTMAPFRHFADRHVNVFIDHRVVRLYRTRFSAPYLHLALQSGWGFLSNPERHIPLLEDYRDGYHEAGMIFESILRYEVLSLMEVSLNAGGWYRYGPYATNNFSDDFAIKLGMDLSF